MISTAYTRFVMRGNYIHSMSALTSLQIDVIDHNCSWKGKRIVACFDIDTNSMLYISITAMYVQLYCIITYNLFSVGLIIAVQ
jgi:hypothetical protein